MGKSAYVNPDALLVSAGGIDLCLELGRDERQHVLASPEKDLASGVVGSGL
jgi:hypothetical protein